jgi:hypothetical protein
MEIRPFISFCLRPVVKFQDETDIEDVRESLIEGREIGHVRRWTGGRNRIWVLPSDELNDLIAGLSPDSAGEPVVDALGLNMPRGGGPQEELAMLAIQYPEEHGVACAQPAAIDANWSAANYYLSYPLEDGWGRTQSRSGANMRVRERIHQDFTCGLDNRYRVEYIGLAPQRKENRPKLVEEALKRLGYWDDSDDRTELRVAQP